MKHCTLHARFEPTCGYCRHRQQEALEVVETTAETYPAPASLVVDAVFEVLSDSSSASTDSSTGGFDGFGGGGADGSF